MTTIPTIEPASLVAGDTAKWTRCYADYDPATWTLRYDLVKTGNHETITASDNGDGSFLVNVAAADTVGWAPGVYEWQARVSRTGPDESYVIGRGTLEVQVDFAQQSQGGYDPRSHVKRVLDAIEAAIEGRAGRTELGYTIGSRTISQMGHEELVNMRARYKQYYRQERDRERIARGLPSRSKIRTRF